MSEFSCGAVGQGSGVVTALAWVAAVAQVQSLALEILHAVGMIPFPKKSLSSGKQIKAKNKKRKKKKKLQNSFSQARITITHHVIFLLFTLVAKMNRAKFISC